MIFIQSVSPCQKHSITWSDQLTQHFQHDPARLSLTGRGHVGHLACCGLFTFSGGALAALFAPTVSLMGWGLAVGQAVMKRVLMSKMRMMQGNADMDVESGDDDHRQDEEEESGELKDMTHAR